MRALRIGDRLISDDEPAYVIAEIGCNHGGSLDRALQLVRVAADARVDAVKFQVRSIEKIYTPGDLTRPYTGRHSFGASYGAHRRALELAPAQLETIWAAAQDLGLHCLATPFDPWAADRVDALGVLAFKIASGDLGNKSLLRAVAGGGLPVLLSTGGATIAEIQESAAFIGAHGGCGVALLHCTSVYPAMPGQLNLCAITTLREVFPWAVIGYSGHDTGIQAAIIASTLGARIIEKHITLDRASKGTDHAMSLEPAGVRKLVEDLEKARQSMGDGVKRLLSEERPALNKWRSWREAHS